MNIVGVAFLAKAILDDETVPNSAVVAQVRIQLFQHTAFVSTVKDGEIVIELTVIQMERGRLGAVETAIDLQARHDGQVTPELGVFFVQVVVNACLDPDLRFRVEGECKV